MTSFPKLPDYHSLYHQGFICSFCIHKLSLKPKPKTVLLSTPIPRDGAWFYQYPGNPFWVHIIALNKYRCTIFVPKWNQFATLGELQFILLQLGNICPISKCWRSSQVPQATWIGWTAWRDVWGQNGCLPLRKGPAQDWRISPGFKCRWCWDFWWFGIQVQTEGTSCLEDMFHTT